MRRFWLVILVLLAATPAAAKSYRAERFDARIEVQPGGVLRVTETIVFRFEGGTFTRVSRRIPTRRTDGIELVSAAMDGRSFAVGKGAGYVNIRRREGLNFEWQFPAVGHSTHTFDVTYLVRGVAYSEAGTDLVVWRALPSDHDYRIEQSAVEFVLPAKPLGLPTVSTRRVGSWTPDGGDDRRVLITGRDIRKNGWIEVAVRFPAGTLVQSAPAWQQRRALHDSYRDRLLMIAGGVLLAGLILLFGLRQSYDAPPRDVPASRTFSGPPEAVPPAVAGAIGTNGRPQLEHALAALFDLASRGIIEVHEEKGLWGTRGFVLTRLQTSTHLAPHEHAVLDTVFKDGADRVSLSKARSHLTMKFSKVRAAIEEELLHAGLIDPGRRQVRNRFTAAGVLFLLLALISAIAVVLVIERFGPWLLAIPAALIVIGVVALIVAGATTPLTNDGVRRSAQWRAYRKHLREIPRDSGQREAYLSGNASAATLLPLAVALGLGVLWAKLFRSRGAALPDWFHAAASADAHRAFVAFVGTGGAGAHGGGGAGGGGGAAGGGSSGAS